MITIDTSALAPTELETLLRLFYNGESVSHRAYDLLKNAYAAICGQDELGELMSEIEAIADDQR